MLKTESKVRRGSPSQQQVLPSQKQALSATQQQTLITIAGIDRKVGTTHLALSLALKASARGLSCGVILQPDSFESLKQCYVLSVRKENPEGCSSARQFASFAGISIMCGVLPGDLDGFQLLVWDCGLLGESKRRFASGDLCCVVSGGQAWELAPLNALLLATSYEDLGNYVVCIRGIDQDDFDYICQQMAGKLPCVFVQHKPKWSDLTLREDLVTLLRLIGH